MIAIMRNAAATIAWIGVAAHLVIGVLTLRRPAGLPVYPLLALLNLAVAVCVLGYWAHAWYGYAVRGVTWYASDQAVPLYAAIVAVASLLALAGRYDGRHANWIQWVAFAIDALVLAGAAFYLTFARFTRLF